MADIEINLESSNPKELVAQAVRAYAIGDFTNAAAAFGRATELMAQEHGDSHDSLGEIYIQYAKSLLELSREENVPFGDAIPQADTESDSEEVEEENKTEDVNKTEEVTKTEDGNKTEEVTKTKDEKKASEDTNKVSKEENKIENGEKKVENNDAKENGITTEAEPNKEENGNKTEADEAEENDAASEPPEDCSDLQLAWEVLEVAKKIFSNRGDAGKERLAETMILLGEVAMESENFIDGISDMQEGIELQKSLFEPTSRKIAESYYKVGTAQFTISHTAEAVESFEAAIKILKNRIDLLQSQSDDGKTEKELKAKNDEIEEMKALIPEIEEKINDTKTVKEEMTAQILQEMAGVKPKADDGAGSSSASDAQTQKAKDISHLVKRKRKADEEPAEVVSKKPTP